MNLGRFFPCPMRGDHWRKPTNVKDSKPEKNYDALCLRFYRSKQILCIYYLFNKATKKFKPLKSKYSTDVIL